MGRLFTSFDDAWQHFLRREEPLESFHDRFPLDPAAVGEGWLLVPPDGVLRRAERIQERLSGFRGLALTPSHFFHVWLGGADVEQLGAGPRFTARYARVNCFHDAVVVETEAPELAAAGAEATFLPHLTLAYVREPVHPAPLREVLLDVRDEELGEGPVGELLRIRFPSARTTILQPWRVLERVRLGR